MPVVVLAGNGGNGGGGICAARHLANRGAHVTVVVSDEERLGGVPSEQLKVYRGTPGRIASAANCQPSTPLSSLTQSSDTALGAHTGARWGT